MLNWNATKEESLKVSKICDRALEKIHRAKMDLVMDIEAVHSNGCKLDLDKLFEFDDFNFYHDISGITVNLDRETGKLQNCFVPRCAC